MEKGGTRKAWLTAEMNEIILSAQDIDQTFFYPHANSITK
jgi:hypothetical protein